MTESQPETGNEYEREPVPERALLGLKSYVGQYVGEHVAGTELMIGPLFVVHGVSAFDLVFGLLVGNLLAVLSWTLFTAPIATRVRLTLYYQLEKICGRQLVSLYNLANGVMFTLLAGAMITVSTTALGIGFNVDMPGLKDRYPNSVGWVLAVLIVGALFSIVAAGGYRFVARFANLAAPWMILVFVAFGIIGLRQLGVSSLGEFWSVAQTTIWKGGEPADFELEYQARITGNNSGVQYRSKVFDAATWSVGGYQMDLHPDQTYLGQLYEERGRGIVCLRGQRVTLTDKIEVSPPLGCTLGQAKKCPG